MLHFAWQFMWPDRLFFDVWVQEKVAWAHENISVYGNIAWTASYTTIIKCLLGKYFA